MSWLNISVHDNIGKAVA